MEKENRKELIRYIKKNDPSYQEASFDAYSDVVLSMIKKRIDIEKEKKTNTPVKELNREELIEYIKKNDNRYNYDAVNFKYFTDEDLITLRKKIDKRNTNEDKYDAF